MRREMRKGGRLLKVRDPKVMVCVLKRQKPAQFESFYISLGKGLFIVDLLTWVRSMNTRSL